MPSPQTHVMDIVQSVPGLQCGTVSLEGGTTLRTRFMGWGPSLHRTGHNVGITPPAMDRDAIALALEPYLAVQLDRRRRAGALGFHSGQPEVHIGIAHIVADRVLRDIAYELTDGIRSFGQSALMASIPAEARTMRAGDIHVEDGPPDDVRPRAAYVARTPWGWFDGTDLTIEERLPETTVGLLAGRRVADVIDTTRRGPHLARLADREILGARIHAGRTVLTTEGDWTPFLV